MADCQLKIELDQPDTSYVGGQSLSGTVTVRTDGSVTCNALVVSTFWTTHGRGNIAKGDVDQCVVFEGTWEAGREYQYPFTLRVAAWPPTYYGTYLNVSHFVAARAKVPWSFDPKIQREFAVVAREAPADLKPVQPEKAKSLPVLGWIIAAALLLIFGAVFGVLLLFLLPILGMAAGTYWFIRVFLPRRLLGKVEFTVEPARVVAGAAIAGRLRFTPRRDVTIAGIHWTLKCTEKCISGSGSDRKTHNHEVSRTSVCLAKAGILRLNQPQSFEFTFPVSEHAPLSLKFTDNELAWQGALRIDIPSWPDWVKSCPITVVPSGRLPTSPVPIGAASARTVAPAAAGDEAAWFDEVVQQVERSSGDPDRLQAVLAAVQDQVFSVQVDLAGARREPPEQFRNRPGTWLFAAYRPQDVEFCLLWPAPGVSPAAHLANWRGQAAIIGYDDEFDCLLLRVVDS